MADDQVNRALDEVSLRARNDEVLASLLQELERAVIADDYRSILHVAGAAAWKVAFLCGTESGQQQVTKRLVGLEILAATKWPAGGGAST